MFGKVNDYKEKELSETELIISFKLFCKSGIVFVDYSFQLEWIDMLKMLLNQTGSPVKGILYVKSKWKAAKSPFYIFLYND